MKLKEHVVVARSMVKLNRKVSEMFCRKPKGFNKLTKAEIAPMLFLVKHIDRVRNILDNVYCRSVDDKTFDKLGYIYYKVKDDRTKTKS